LKVVEVQAGRTTLLDDDDLEVQTELPGFPEKMDGEKRAGWSAADDDDAIAVQETRRLNRNCHFAFPGMREDTPPIARLAIFSCIRSKGKGPVVPGRAFARTKKSLFALFRSDFTAARGKTLSFANRHDLLKPICQDRSRAVSLKFVAI
jgi:hypothetical protein